MSNQFDIFEMMGMKPAEPAKEEKKNSKTSSKKPESSNKSDKKQEEKVKLPVTVYTGYCEPRTINPEDFAPKNEITVKEAHEYLTNTMEDYPQGITVLQKGKGNVLYLIHKASYKVEKGSIHMNKDTKFMLAGSQFDISAIKTADECNVDCKELEKLFGNAFKEYGKVGFIHSALSDVIIPTFSFPALTVEATLPVKIGVFGRQDIIIFKEDYLAFATKSNPKDDEEEDEEENENEGEDESNSETSKETVKADKEILMEMVIDKYPDFAEDHLELQWNKDAKMVIAKMVEKKEAPAKTAEESYPTNALLSLLYTKIQLSPEMFGGKEKVEKEELRKYIEKDRPEYSKERTNISYEKEQNLIIMVCTGSRKGAELVTDDLAAMEKIQGTTDMLFDLYKEGYLYRVEKTDAFCIIAPKPNPNKGGFNLLLPKVPYALYNMAEAFFKNVYDQYKSEAMLQLFWDKEKEEYFWYVPVQTVGPDSCKIKRNEEVEKAYTLVGDFHSHGFYNAFFSNIDNKDENGFRIYGVYGSFDDEERSFKLRAGTGGCFVELNEDNVFSYDENLYDKSMLKKLYEDAEIRIRFIY